MGRVLPALFSLLLLGLALELGACTCGGVPGGDASGGTSGAGGGTMTSRAMLVCQSMSQSSCNALVRCRAEASPGVLITADMCGQTVPSATRDCEATSGAAITASGDAPLAACQNALAGLTCSSICNRVPTDPPECVGVPGYDPTTSFVTCQP